MTEFCSRHGIPKTQSRHRSNRLVCPMCSEQMQNAQLLPYERSFDTMAKVTVQYLLSQGYQFQTDNQGISRLKRQERENEEKTQATV